VETQADMSREIEALRGSGGPQPRRDYPPYRSSVLRHPTRDLHQVDPEGVELWAPCFGAADIDDAEADLTIQRSGEPLGERIVVTGRVIDGDGRPVRNQLVEIWQANASGRYWHQRDQHPAPLDPNFIGAGRCLTDDDGSYTFQTIKPGAYPWRNHLNAWRPAHIHFSLFGRAFPQRLVTQMYFPDDPLFFQDPIFNSAPEAARPRMISAYDHDITQDHWALGFRFDIVLRGSAQTPFESEPDDD
jgi:protocatechuate 3,4-dioxygenase, beta subunit